MWPIIRIIANGISKVGGRVISSRSAIRRSTKLLPPTVSGKGTRGSWSGIFGKRLSKIDDAKLTKRGALLRRILNAGAWGLTAHELYNFFASDTTKEAKDGNSSFSESEDASITNVLDMEKDVRVLNELSGQYVAEPSKGSYPQDSAYSPLMRAITLLFSERVIWSSGELPLNRVREINNLSIQDRAYGISLLNTIAKRLCGTDEYSDILNALRVQNATSIATVSVPTRSFSLLAKSNMLDSKAVATSCREYVATVAGLVDELTASSLDEVFDQNTSKVDLFDLSSPTAAESYAAVSSSASGAIISFHCSNLSTDIKIVALDGVFDRLSVDSDGSDDESGVVRYLYNMQRPSHSFREFMIALQAGETDRSLYARTIKDR